VSLDDIFTSNGFISSNSSISSGLNVDGNKTYPELEAAPVRKFGEEPTNRVLPFDLKEEDYEDEDEDLIELDLESVAEMTNTIPSDYCARILRSDLLRVLKKLKPRLARQSQSEDSDTESLLQSYLDFDISQVVSPLLNIMGSAMTRNATAIDEHYKQLPPLVKTEITDILSVFTEVLKTS